MSAASSVLDTPIILYIKNENTHEAMISHLSNLQFNKTTHVKDTKELHDAASENANSLIIMDWNEKETALLLEKFKHSKTHYQPIYLLINLDNPNILNILSDYEITIVQVAPPSKSQVTQALKTIFSNKSPIAEQVEQFHQVTTARHDDNLIDAETILRDLIETHPDNLKYRSELASILIEQGEWHEANQIVSEILAQDRSLPRALHLKARCLLQDKHYDKAADYMSKCTSLNPYSVSRLIALGNVLLSKADPQLARNAFVSAEDLDAANLEAKKGIAVCDMVTERISEAVSFLQELNSESEMASVFNNAGVVAIKQGKTADAMKLYGIAESMLKSKSLLARVMYNHALAYFRSHDQDSAIEYLKKSIKADPHFEKAIRLFNKYKSNYEITLTGIEVDFESFDEEF